MLFRTKFLLANAILACVALGCAIVLIISTGQSENNQTRTTLAYESLSGYLQLSGSVFRTFKQARRDLLSGSGRLAFDLAEARGNILNTFDVLEQATIAEDALNRANDGALANVHRLRAATTHALDRIKTASELIQSGDTDAGSALAVDVLEQQVDIEIGGMIEAGIAQERQNLQRLHEELQQFNELSKTIAILSALTALFVTIAVLVFLARRLSSGLKALEIGAQQFASANLAHVIDLPGTDELSELGNSFNRMAQEIQTERQASERIKQDLEVTVRERTEALSQANGALHERDRLRRQFFADIGHELRTPVTAIRGEAEVALRSRQDREQNYGEALTRIVTLTKQLTDYVSDLFLIAREQAEMLDFRQQVLDLNAPVRQSVEDLRAMIRESGATLILDLSPDGLRIEGDAKRIVQLVQVLITNALCHAPRGVTITVVTRNADGHAMLAIGDDGPGIPERDRARIFDRLVRGPSQRFRHAGGTGLGLAIAKSITQAHGGAIAVGESPAGGANFVARFPLAPKGGGT
ncbi:sensor histidine kinase [Actibacterium ureilyticum]|uniref:sensor histidine kinase n=1 Tax=Actibacterium ureilyticum TaxID=1590614 RepID=UPI000BAABF31|nr:HAMP domain-containing sensor histidine kinase [Actibacterium ureilyticum]